MHSTQSSQVVPIGRQAPVVTTVHPSNDNNILHNYASRTSIALGITQVTCGGICIVFQFVAILLKSANMEGGSGIWCGVMFVVAGGLSIASGKHKTKCLVVGAMVTSIVAAVFCLSLLCVSAIGITIDHNDGYGRYDYYNSYNQEYIRPSVGKERSRIAMNAVLVVFAIIEAGAAIWQACICCNPLCCTTTNVTQGSHQVIYNAGSGAVTTGQLPNGQQIIILNSNGQQQPAMQQQTGTVVMQAPCQGNMVMIPASSLQTQQYATHQEQRFVQQNIGTQQQTHPTIMVQTPQYQQQHSPPPQYVHISNPEALSRNNQATAIGVDVLHTEKTNNCDGEKKEVL